MPNVKNYQSNFSFGEISPKLAGRKDLQSYQAGCEKLNNFNPSIQGTVSFRKGFQFISELGENQRLIPFAPSDRENFLLIFGLNQVEAFDGDKIFNLNAPEDNPLKIVYAQFQYGNGVSTERRNNRGIKVKGTEYSYVYFSFTFNKDHNYKVGDRIEGIAPIPSTGQGNFFYNPLTLNQHGDPIPYARGVPNPLDISTYEIVNVLSNRIVQIRHWVYPFFILGQTPASGGGPVSFLNTSVSTGDFSFTKEELQEFHYTQYGRKLIITHKNFPPRTVDYEDGLFLGELDLKTGTDGIEKDSGIFSWYLGEGNFPKTCASFKQRLALGGSEKYPNRLWGSEIGKINSFTPGTDEDKAFQYDINFGDTINSIRSMNSTNRGLVIGTGSNYITVHGASRGATISPTSINISEFDNYGSNSSPIIIKDNNSFYITNDEKKVRASVYFAESDAFSPEEISLIAEHITEVGLVKGIYVKGSTDYLVFLRKDGTLASCSFFNSGSNRLVSWFTTKTKGEILDIAVISDNGDYDKFYIYVKRDGKYFLECVTGDFSFSRSVDFQFDSESLNDANVKLSDSLVEEVKKYSFLDSWEKIENSQYIPLINRFFNKNISIVGDGEYLGEFLLGSPISLEREYNVIYIGYKYKGEIVTNRVGDVDINGSTFHNYKRINKVTADLLDSIGTKFGSNPFSMEKVRTRRFDHSRMTDPPLPSSSIVNINVRSATSRETKVFICQDLPFPAKIRAITVFYDVVEGM